MTKREINIRIFQRQRIPRVLFQPRIEWWYQYNKREETLPERYSEMSLSELFDDLDISIRYFSYATGLPSAVEMEHSDEIRVTEKVEGRQRITIIGTPKGQMVRETDMSPEGGRVVQYPIKSNEDLEKAICFFRNTRFRFIEDNFEKGRRFIEDRGEPQFFVPRSGYQHLAINGMGVENLIYALADVPQKVERLMEAIDNSYNALYEDIISYGKIRILNFGENIDGNIVSPRYFEKYCIPFYEKRSRQLQKAGIYTHIHIDGSFRPLLKYLKDLPFDGLEALTPFPQGDVTLEEMREAIDDKVLLDGIPAILFLPDYPLEELERCVEKIVDFFHPRLVLGISDELPPPADIERVRLVSRIVDN